MRTIYNMNGKWAFTKQNDTLPAVMPRNWDWVNLPHCWNAIDGQDGGNDYYRGMGWYAKSVDRLDLPQADRYFLELQGANSSADVYVNGTHLAHHDGGYSTWRVDVTDVLQRDNLFVVSVDNRKNDRVYPQNADFTFYGGLYRDVNLICVNQSHVQLDYYGSSGLKVTPKIVGRDAQIEIETWVTGFKPGQSLRYTISTPCGRTVANVESADTKATLAIADVHLWHGRKDPYLYTACVDLMEDGQVIDAVSASFGCRTYAIDPERGFILNGEEYPLRGVCRHQDRWGIGNALLPEHHVEDMDLICEMGANTIRLAHYQHDQRFYDLCDQRGMVVWAEIPYISQHMPNGRENTITQMTELVAQNYNHPSIVVWGLSNEITINTDEALLENHRVLNDLCHRMDPTRLTSVAVLAACPGDSPYLRIPDVVSYNLYFGWYVGTPDMNGPWFDEFHTAYPEIPIGCSEYGCEALNWHSSDPSQGDYTEEYQAYYHEELIRQLFTRKYLWATHVWNMFDFGADARNEGGENGQNHKGLVTIDRKYKKDSFYAYKAWLSDEPFVHLCGKRYVDRVEEVTKVRVYSNQPEVELFANGLSLGKKRAEDHFFCFEVPNAGRTILVARAGEVEDRSEINKVDEFPARYRLSQRGVILNWFDITEPEGCLSLNSKIREVMATSGGRRIFERYIACHMPPNGEKFLGYVMNDNMIRMMSNFTMLYIFDYLTDRRKIPYTKDDLLDINTQLNQVRKEQQ